MPSFVHKYYSFIFLIFLAIIVGLSFYLGYQKGIMTKSAGNKQIVFSCPNTILDKQRISGLPVQSSESPTNSISNTEVTPSIENKNGGAYVGSKNGTKYYTPGCPGSNRIKPENYVWFQSAEDATLQGYSKGSC